MNKIYFGVVEDRTSDPLKLGRCKVRVVGIHTEDKVALPTADLPWSVILQPTTSAANSGVGSSPTGILPGTWVAIVFRDEYNQHPIIIGTIPGVPTKEVPEATNVVRSGDGSVWVDGSGQPITTGTQESATKKEEEPPVEFGKPGLMKPSAAAFDLIKSVEGLASLEPGRGKKPKIGSISTPYETKLYAYLDSVNKWTIGWGTTSDAYSSSGIYVTESTTITRKEADTYLEAFVNRDCVSSIKRNVKVPLTQSMYDAICSMIYNMGSAGFNQTDVIKSLNAGDYAAAAAHIPTARNNGGTLTGRRNKEKALFLKDGIPQDDGTAKKIPTEETVTPDATQNPVVKKDERFLPQTTVIRQKTLPGFEDPSGIYPRFTNEPDTHRLARGDRIDGTIVYKKETARARGVTTATGSTWSQPQIPYNATYPYNSVFASESGHIQEFDDTPGSERYHLYHKAGSFVEIDRNGTMVRRIVGDDFTILERNGSVLIRGNCNLTIVGDANIRVENNATIESLGTMDIKAGGDIGIGSNGNIRFSAAGEFSVDATQIHWNSGKGGSVKKASGSAGGAVSFNELSTPTRTTVGDAAYETPEEGATVDKTEELDVVPVVPTEETKMEEKPKVQEPEAGCDLIFKETSFGPEYRLTQNFTIKDLFKGSSGIPSGKNFGLSAQEIVCNVKQLAENCLEPIKKKYPNMTITNTWRSEAVNTKVGGSKTSDHLFGYAADIQFTGFSRAQHHAAVQEIYKMLPTFQQLILEYKNGSTWIHVSYSTKKGNKKEALTIDAATNKTLSRGSYVLA